jgi:hypothetical protein
MRAIAVSRWGPRSRARANPSCGNGGATPLYRKARDSRRLAPDRSCLSLFGRAVRRWRRYGFPTKVVTDCPPSEAANLPAETGMVGPGARLELVDVT